MPRKKTTTRKDGPAVVVAPVDDVTGLVTVYPVDPVDMPEVARRLLQAGGPVGTVSAPLGFTATEAAVKSAGLGATP